VQCLQVSLLSVTTEEDDSIPTGWAYGGSRSGRLVGSPPPFVPFAKAALVEKRQLLGRGGLSYRIIRPLPASTATGAKSSDRPTDRRRWRGKRTTAWSLWTCDSFRGVQTVVRSVLISRTTVSVGPTVRVAVLRSHAVAGANGARCGRRGLVPSDPSPARLDANRTGSRRWCEFRRRVPAEHWFRIGLQQNCPLEDDDASPWRPRRAAYVRGGRTREMSVQ
jgi:hypothetical protein